MSLTLSLLLLSVLAETPPRFMSSWTRGDRLEASDRQKKLGRDDVSRLCSTGCRKLGGVSVCAWRGESRMACAGGLVDSRSDWSATMFWHRAETSSSVRSSVGSCPSARASDASDDLSWVWR